ncbi:TetR/AcrR family transcriptional regulator [Tsukamurella sp. 8F]|uniref:TetR/AcrR family transcriptional regulator n=1 Tax=unclassified Tsukamurella TaxID=2633480 RepID=UPI0023BA3882|nr:MULTISPECIES: TetR/AcrR family transcriptional regulator [unclassified Tsukamurella]MDF0531479.1 TetR/AcrR family transcriptional regulator [Tsukamurella sp. 8J]MDF0588723.1 TetR/AcrR family transcriptional regulator [Tsukamurella sp. 8F]
MTTTRTRLRPADRRRQLIEIASALFTERGYAHVSIADIARAAGVTGPSLYRHFPDKQAILAAAMGSAVDEMEAITDDVLSRPHARFADLLAGVVAMAVSDPAPTVLWRWNRRHLAPEQARTMIGRSEAVLGRWVELLRSERPGLSDDDARVLAWAALAVAGSVPISRGRIGVRRYRGELEHVGARVLGAPPSSAPRLPPPPVRHARTIRHDELIDAASRLFFDEGYGNVGIDDIGAAVGISGPSVYRHFPSKSSILLAVCNRAAAALEVGVAEAYSASNDPIEQLRALVRSYAANLVVSTDLAVAFTVGREVLIEAGGEALLASQRAYVARWCSLLETRTDPAGARITVGAAMTIANDFARTRRLRRRPHFYNELVYLVETALGV